MESHFTLNQLTFTLTFAIIYVFMTRQLIEIC